MPGGTLLGSSSESNHGAGPSPTNLQYPSFRASACSSVAFWTSASRRKLIPSAPRNSDCVIGPYTAEPTVAKKKKERKEELLAYYTATWSIQEF